MTTPSRRTVLRTSLVLAGGSLAVAAGCSPDDQGASDPGKETSAPDDPSTDPSASNSTPSGDGSAQPEGPSVAKADVPEGGGVVLSEGGDFVVTQPEAGEYKAFSSICTHQGCPVAEVTDGQILCPCHGSAFSVADGSVLQGPAKAPLEAAAVAESGDQLVIS
ncbi:MAG: Rieske (2Fe-2S) protein [Propionibacteriaceae bacterium]